VNILHRFVLAGLVLFMVTQVAHAALFDDEEARKRIDATNQRLSAMQRQIDDRLLLLEQQAKSGGLADLATQIQLLQGDMAKLRGQIEVVTYELEQSQKRQRDLYVDLDTRLRKMEAAAASAAESANAANAANAANPANTASTGTPPAGNATVVAPPAATVAAPPPATVAAPPTTVAVAPPVRNSSDGVAEQRAYDAALDLFKRGDYQGAITGFGSFIKTYPRSPLGFGESDNLVPRPIEQRRCLDQRILAVPAGQRHGAALVRLVGAQARDPGRSAGKGAIERFDLADVTAAKARLLAVIEAVDPGIVDHSRQGAGIGVEGSDPDAVFFLGSGPGFIGFGEKPTGIERGDLNLEPVRENEVADRLVFDTEAGREYDLPGDHLAQGDQSLERGCAGDTRNRGFRRRRRQRSCPLRRWLLRRISLQHGIVLRSPSPVILRA